MFKIKFNLIEEKVLKSLFPNNIESLYLFGGEIFLALAILFYLISFSKFKGNYLNKNSILTKHLLNAFYILLFYYIFLGSIFTDTYFVHNRLYIIDSYTMLFKILIVITTIIILNTPLIVKTKLSSNLLEYPIIVSVASLNFLLFISSFDLMSMYLTIEAASLALYTLASLNFTGEVSIEAGIKYFTVGAISSSILIFSISLIYGAIKKTDFLYLHKYLWLFSKGDLYLNIELCLFGLGGILIGFLFKVSAFPCHFWTPDVYEGCPLNITAFFAITVKLSVISFLFRFWGYLLKNIFYNFQFIFYFISIGSILVGCFCAILTQRIKRFIAYSTINHIGYIFSGLTINSFAGLKSAILYLLIYIFTNLIFFVFVFRINSTFIKIKNITYWSDFTRFCQYDNYNFIYFSLILLSMAGIPPFLGFFSKYILLLSLYEKKFIFLTFTILLVSTISCYYYLSIIVTTWNTLNKDKVFKYFFFVKIKAINSVNIFIFAHMIFFLTFDKISIIFNNLTLSCLFLMNIKKLSVNLIFIALQQNDNSRFFSFYV